MTNDEIKYCTIWLADLNPPKGTEVGKTRPVLVIQTDLINSIHDSTLICPFTTKHSDSELTKIKVEPSKINGLQESSWIVMDQIRAIDNRRFVKKVGQLESFYLEKVKKSLRILLELD